MGTAVAGEGAAAPPLRVFFIPFFVPSHMNPMLRVACQFAARGVDSTMVVTPANAALIRGAVDRAARDGHPVRILPYPFPSAEIGLPEGVEDLSAVHPDDEAKVYRAVDAVQGAHGSILREHRPDAVVADVPFWWATDIARELGIPRLVFLPVGAFPLVVMSSLGRHRPYAALEGEENGPFRVDHIPDPFEMFKSELPNFLRVRDAHAENADRFRRAQLESYGILLSSIYELEPAYGDQLRREECRDGFCIYASSNGEGGRGEASDDCTAWLDGRATASVVYVAFGSFSYFSKEQHWEMARGLEASGRPFLWALKEKSFAGGAADWLPEGFEERVRSRGLVVRGWVPQVEILGHRATGAFVSHLGWNSLIEALLAGVPVISWPLAYEQFINERLVVQKLGVGIPMWGGYRSSLKEEAARAVVSAEAIARVVARFVPPGDGDDEEVAALRTRAREIAAVAGAAVAEGGSCFREMDRLIAGLRAFRSGINK